MNKFEALLTAGAQKGNDLKVPWAKDICANANDADPACWVALASGAYLPDAPAQLLEHTIISQVGASKSTKDQNDPDGISVLDFDVSYVDDAYLPIAFTRTTSPAGPPGQPEHQSDPDGVVDGRSAALAESSRSLGIRQAASPRTAAARR